jgi:hypothetical protein
MNEDFVTARQIAERLHVKTSTIWEWTRRRQAESDSALSRQPEDRAIQVERGRALGGRAPTIAAHRSCYNHWMPKIVEQWLLFKYIGGRFTPLSKPFKTRERAEKARLKYPQRERKSIGLGVVRLPKDE